MLIELGFGDGNRRAPRFMLASMPFVTFEGAEGCGKSTQLSLAAERLRAAGRDVFTTREPGGTPIAEKIRGVLLDPANTALEPMTEWLLVEAARRQHAHEVLRPVLARGTFVLCDRFSDSTEAYQVGGRGLDAALVSALDARVRDGLSPDLTLVFDLDVREGLARARRRDAGAGRFESADLAFHERVRAAFLAIARREPGRVAVIAADGEASAVFERAWTVIERRFALA